MQFERTCFVAHIENFDLQFDLPYFFGTCAFKCHVQASFIAIVVSIRINLHVYCGSSAFEGVYEHESFCLFVMDYTELKINIQFIPFPSLSFNNVYGYQIFSKFLKPDAMNSTSFRAV